MILRPSSLRNCTRYKMVRNGTKTNLQCFHVQPSSRAKAATSIQQSVEGHGALSIFVGQRSRLLSRSASPSVAGWRVRRFCHRRAPGAPQSPRRGNATHGVNPHRAIPFSRCQGPLAATRGPFVSKAWLLAKGTGDGGWMTLS